MYLRAFERGHRHTVAEQHPVARGAAQAGFVIENAEQVRRVTGEITQAADNFGEFKITDDSGTVNTVSLDAEINRRGVGFDVGTRVQATGPVLYSYSAYTIVIMNVGQLAELEE